MATRSYTAAEYRKAGINAGPYALESNPDQNYRTSRRKPILGVVMHITAGMTDYSGADTSADATTRYGATTARDASWHVCIDSDGIIPSVRDAYTAWHAGVTSDYWSHPGRPYVNDATLGIEQGTGSTNWAGMPDWWVERTLRNVAVWLAPRVKKYGIPLTVVRDRNVVGNAIVAGKPFGFVSHAVMAPHNRTDPGVYQGRDTYPWSQLFTYIREEIALLNGTAPAPAPTPAQEWYLMADIPADNLAQIADAVWAKMIDHPSEAGRQWPARTGLWSANVYAYQAANRPAAAVDVAALASEIVVRLPAGVLSKDDVEASLRKVLGSVDNEPSAT